MIRGLLSVPGFVLSLLWSLFFPREHPLAPTPSPAPNPNAPSAESQADGHELSDARPKIVALFVGALFLVIFGSMAALGWMYTHLYTDTKAMPVPSSQQSFRNAPIARTSIAKDWQTIGDLTRQHLDGYGWTDRAAGVTRIPIARAMALVTAEGLPARAGKTPDFPPPEQEKLPLMELESTADATK